MIPFRYPQDCKVFAVSLSESETPLVSVIMPVYNAPPVEFKRCVDSLVNQTYRNIEIIIVDDGSNQKCADCIREAAKQDARIRVVDGDHKGVSSARNMGITEAQGEWVAFSDADDENAPQFIEQALSIALSQNCDLVCGTVQTLYANDKKNATSDDFNGYETNPDNQAVEIKELAWQMLGNLKRASLEGPNYRGRGPWGKLYRASLLNDVAYDVNVPIGEDTLFNYRVIEKAKRMALVDAVWYWYYQYAGSAVHSAQIEPWKQSIDGILAARRNNEDETPFVSRCAFMTTQAIASFTTSDGFWGARKKSADLLKYARKKGVFSANVFRGFDLSFGRKLLTALCRRGCYSVAYFYWILKDTIKGGRKNVLPKKQASATLVDGRAI